MVTRWLGWQNEVFSLQGIQLSSLCLHVCRSIHPGRVSEASETLSRMYTLLLHVCSQYCQVILCLQEAWHLSFHFLCIGGISARKPTKQT